MARLVNELKAINDITPALVRHFFVDVQSDVFPGVSKSMEVIITQPVGPSGPLWSQSLRYCSESRQRRGLARTSTEGNRKAGRWLDSRTSDRLRRRAYAIWAACYDIRNL